MRWAGLAFAIPLLLAGCSDGGTADPAGADGDDPLDAIQNGTANLRPIPVLDADVLEGPAPLTVTFALNGTDPDGDAIRWTLDVEGDGTADFNGTALPAAVNHTYTVQGQFNATYRLGDGQVEAQAVLAVNVTGEAAGYAPAQAPITLTGSATGLLGEGAPGSTDHPFEVEPGQRLIHATIQYGAACGGDIDWSLLDPNGAEADAAASGSVSGEDPLDATDPAPGTWTIHTVAFSSACASYTVTVSFE